MKELIGQRSLASWLASALNVGWYLMLVFIAFLAVFSIYGFVTAVEGKFNTTSFSVSVQKERPGLPILLSADGEEPRGSLIVTQGS